MINILLLFKPLYLKHVENLDAEVIVEVDIFGLGHVVDENEAIALRLMTI